MISRLINIHTHHPSEDQITPQTIGIHPWDASGRHAAELKPLPSSVQVIGEVGLDFACEVAHAEQLRVLHEQLILAECNQLPVVLHCVRAFEPMLDALKGYNLPAVIFHGFIGSPEQAARATQCGYYLSFGERTFRSPKTIEALRKTPLHHIFCETDHSDLTIDQIYTLTAAIKGVSKQELAQAIEKNYKQIFKYND